MAPKNKEAAAKEAYAKGREYTTAYHN